MIHPQLTNTNCDEICDENCRDITSLAARHRETKPKLLGHILNKATWQLRDLKSRQTTNWQRYLSTLSCPPKRNKRRATAKSMYEPSPETLRVERRRNGDIWTRHLLGANTVVGVSRRFTITLQHLINRRHHGSTAAVDLRHRI